MAQLEINDKTKKMIDARLQKLSAVEVGLEKHNSYGCNGRQDGSYRCSKH